MLCHENQNAKSIEEWKKRMKIFISYIKTNILWVIFFIALILFQTVYMHLAGISQNDCIYGLVLGSIVFLAVFCSAFAVYFKKYKKLQRIELLDIDEQSYMPETSDCIEQLYQDIVENQVISRKQMRADKDKTNSEMLQYYGMWVHQSDVQASVYRFKYQNRRIYSEFYAKMLAEQYGSAVRRWKICLIIPIPLYRKRRRQRGYNQSELVAKKLGKILDIPVDSKNLRRVRNTNPQKKMNARGRRTNLRNAFRVRDGFAPVQSVLLIDDIYTTGNTIDCAARELKKAGVQKVYFLTISIGQGY